MSQKIPDILSSAYASGKLKTLSGDPIDFHSGITLEEAEMLTRVVNENKATSTLEVGLAMGTSAACFCDAGSRLSKDAIHVAIDPFQHTDWKGVGLRLIKDGGYEANFRLLEGKTHEVFHELLEKGVKLDMAFIDGWHTFDYTFIDFFFIDKVLKDGGVLAFHDMYALSKQKVLRFIKTHRDYEILYQYRIKEKDRFKTLKFFIWRILQKPALLFSWYHWTFQTRSPYGIIFLRKKSSFEPNFDFYKRF